MAWSHVDSANGRVRVLVADDVPNGPAKMQAVVEAINGPIWSELVRVMGRDPLVPPGGLIKVEIVATLPGADGVTRPVAGCAATSAHIQLKGSLPIGDDAHPGLIHAAAHEMMHVFQYAFPVAAPADGCSDYDWLAESTAMWFEGVAYPSANSHRAFASKFLNTPHLRIVDRFDNRDYGSYVLPFFLAREYGVNDTRIGAVWRECGTRGSLEALDAVIPADARDDSGEYQPVTWPFWSQFYHQLWNRQPNDHFRMLDNLTQGATAHADDGRYIANQPIPINAGSGVGEVLLKGTLKHSSSRYYHFAFPDDSVRSVYIYDGLSRRLDTQFRNYFCPQCGDTPVYEIDWASDRSAGAVFDVRWRLKGQTQWYYASMDGVPEVGFCRDRATERLDELVVVLANAETNRSYTLQPQNDRPVVLYSNVSCYAYSGSFTSSYQPTSGPRWQITGQVTIRRVGQDTPQAFGGLNPAQGALPSAIDGPAIQFDVVSGSGTYDVSGSDEYCTYSGSGSIGDLQGTFVVLAGSQAGPEQSAYDGVIGLGPTAEMQYSWSCDYPGTGHEEGTASWGPSTAIFATRDSTSQTAPAPKVGGSGTTLQGQATAGNGTETFSWSLTAQPD